ncbi:MAG: diacylglycerol/lipid kinase family protein [Bacteroidia bacterium]
MIERIAVLYNSFAGKGKAEKLIPEINEFLINASFLVSTFRNEYPENLNDFNLLIVVGGDGTIQNVFNHYKDIPIPVLLIKAGTGNDFFEHLYANSNWKQQLDKIKNNKTSLIDAGICNDKIFLNGLGIGFDGEVVKSGLGKKWFTGKAAYMSTVLSLLFTHKSCHIEVDFGDVKLKDSMFMLSVANGSTYGGGFKVAPNADLKDGVLEFSWVKDISLFQRMRYLPVIEKGKHLDLPFINYKQIEKVVIRSNKTIQAHLDGEWFESNVFEVEILKEKYQFLV